jgi:hypothetical protein
MGGIDLVISGALRGIYGILLAQGDVVATLSVMLLWFSVMFVMARIAFGLAGLTLFLIGRADALHFINAVATAMSLLFAALLWSPAQVLGTAIFQVEDNLERTDSVECVRLSAPGDLSACAQLVAIYALLESLITLVLGTPLLVGILIYMRRRGVPRLSVVYVMIALMMILQSIWLLGLMSRAVT